MAMGELGRLGLGLTPRNVAAISEPTDVPSNTSLPSAVGVATVGQSIGGSNGLWDQPPITGYAYQHQESATGSGAGSNISGATSANHTLGSGLVGKYFRRGVKASNAIGAAADFAYSAYIGPIVAAPAITGTPATTGTEGGSYSATFSKSGGRGTGAWELTGSEAGFSFNSSTGALTAATLGPPGDYGPFSVRWVDDDGIASNTIGPWTVTVSAGSSSPEMKFNAAGNSQYIPLIGA